MNRLIMHYIKSLFLVLCFTHMAVANEPSKPWATLIDPSFNLYKMTPFLYRSGLPDSSKVELLKQYKINTVITFIKEDDMVWIGDNNMRLIRYPVHADRVDDDDVLFVLDTILQVQASGGNVLIHCKHGQNRTGLFAAMYRIVIQHWTKEEAADEMINGGFASMDDVEDAIGYLKEADIKKIRSALERKDCSTDRFDLCRLANPNRGDIENVIN